MKQCLVIAYYDDGQPWDLPLSESVLNIRYNTFQAPLPGGFVRSSVGATHNEQRYIPKKLQYPEMNEGKIA